MHTCTEGPTHTHTYAITHARMYSVRYVLPDSVVIRSVIVTEITDEAL